MKDPQRKDIHHRFENWYKLTYFIPPNGLDQRKDGSYKDDFVQSLLIAYRAGFNRARKEGKERLKYEAFVGERLCDITGD